MFGIGLWQKLFESRKNICFEAIQNGCRTSRIFQSWTEVYHKIFHGSHMQTMWNLKKKMWCVQRNVFDFKVLTNGQNIGLTLWAWVNRSAQAMEAHSLSGKEKGLGAVINKEGHTDGNLGRSHRSWFSC